MHNNVKPPLFSLGQIVATPGALEFLHQHRSNAMLLLWRHATGEWGSLCAEAVAANAAALRNGARLLSSYDVGDGKIWLITEADRSVTTLLLPSEY